MPYVMKQGEVRMYVMDDLDIGACNLVPDTSPPTLPLSVPVFWKYLVFEFVERTLLEVLEDHSNGLSQEQVGWALVSRQWDHSNGLLQEPVGQV